MNNDTNYLHHIMASQLLHFVIIVIVWIGMWNLIESLISLVVPNPSTIQRILIYGAISGIGIWLYAITTPQEISDAEGTLQGRIVI